MSFMQDLRLLSSVPPLEGDNISQRYYGDWSCEAQTIPVAVVRPGSTEELSTVLRLCHANDQKVAVQGGLTGLCGGANPQSGELAISLERLAGVEEIDTAAMTMTVRAGTPLQVIQEAALAEGFVFPLDLGARGSCQIGGNVSTNAGGNQVLRYGMTRALVLGLEVVLADGTILCNMNKMLKNNAGYDLKHLFIGTEGTLGIVTRLVLRLFPKSKSRCSALVAVEDFSQVTSLLRRLSADMGPALSAFEVMWDGYVNFMLDNIVDLKTPFSQRHPLYVLTEIEGSHQERDQEHFEEVLAAAFEAGEVVDAAIASSARERESFWKIRDGVAEVGKVIKDSGNFDVSVPISVMPEFLRAVQTRLDDNYPGIQFLAFGHVADSNLHFICSTGVHNDIPGISDLVYEVVGKFNGSVSAEHGIGVQKRKVLHRSRSVAEISLMQNLKQALDPKGILNASRVLP
jgi:FAD/FMN-containing dehydrogenase